MTSRFYRCNTLTFSFNLNKTDNVNQTEAQKDAYKDIIDAMKEKLRIEKEESDFQSELEDKNKE
jgi:hypothetical protein